MAHLRSLIACAVLGTLSGCVQAPSTDGLPDRGLAPAHARYAIAFAPDANVLPRDSGPSLDAAAAAALAGSEVELRVAGAIDESRPLPDRAALSIRRATAIHDALIARGLSRHLIFVDGACSVSGVPVEPWVPPLGARTVKIVISPALPRDACGEL